MHRLETRWFMNIWIDHDGARANWSLGTVLQVTFRIKHIVVSLENKGTSSNIGKA